MPVTPLSRTLLQVGTPLNMSEFDRYSLPRSCHLGLLAPARLTETNSHTHHKTSPSTIEFVEVEERLGFKDWSPLRISDVPQFNSWILGILWKTCSLPYLYENDYHGSAMYSAMRCMSEGKPQFCQPKTFSVRSFSNSPAPASTLQIRLSPQP